jgi:hypothetical protein
MVRDVQPEIRPEVTGKVWKSFENPPSLRLSAWQAADYLPRRAGSGGHGLEAVRRKLCFQLLAETNESSLGCATCFPVFDCGCEADSSFQTRFGLRKEARFQRRRSSYEVMGRSGTWTTRLPKRFCIWQKMERQVLRDEAASSGVCRGGWRNSCDHCLYLLLLIEYEDQLRPRSGCFKHHVPRDNGHHEAFGRRHRCRLRQRRETGRIGNSGSAETFRGGVKPCAG